MMPEHRIVTRDLDVWIDNSHILKKGAVEIPRNRLTVVIGPSGCGKTTLLKCFNRLIDLTDGVQVTGRILVDGVDIYDRGLDPPQGRKRMGLLSQKPFPLPMSIYDNVAYGPRLHGLNDGTNLDQLVERYLR